MRDRLKKFYENHKEAIVASAISAAATGATVTAVSVFKYRQVKFTRFEIWAPDNLSDEALQSGFELALYMQNGKVCVLPAPYLATPSLSTVVPIR